MIRQDAQSADALRQELLRKRLAGRRGGAAAHRAGIPRADRSQPLVLSHGQEQMWFLSRLEPDSTEYLVPLVLRMRGTLDTEALRRAWEQVCARHEVLHTRYEMVDGTAVQIVDEPGPVALRVVEVAGEQAAQDELHRELAEPFDLAAQWPVRGTLMRLADDDHVLAVVFHHIACDAWSTTMFGSELSACYTAQVSDTEARLAELPVQYADFAAWQRAEQQGPRALAQLAYWRKELAGLAPLELPTDRPRPAVRSYAGDDVLFDLDLSLGDQVRAAAKEHGTTAFTVLLSAYQALLGRYAGTQDVAVGTVVSGRTHPDLQGVFGYGINTLVLRGSWDDGTSFAELLDGCRQKVLAAFDHQDVPFARLVDELQPERDQSRTPLYQAAFTLHEWRLDAFSMPGLTAEPFGGSDGMAKCDLTLQAQERPDGTFHCRLQYATSLFERETAERIAAHYVRLLRTALAEPGTRVVRAELLGAEELAAVTAAPRALPQSDALAHQLFEQWAARTPDAVAVTAGGQELSYAEVNGRANRLARHLRELGAGPEQLVGVHLERGAELIPSLLGVLKSGAAYLPLDPANPAERLGYVLSDAKARIVVTTGDLAASLGEVFDGTLIVLDDPATAAALDALAADDLAPVAGPDNAIYT
uniref:condensation domain-containing protein n=1 Tax=Streptomyces sp. CC219B TaxID=3044574 RepID=UPI0024A93D19